MGRNGILDFKSENRWLAGKRKRQTFKADKFLLSCPDKNKTWEGMLFKSSCWKLPVKAYFLNQPFSSTFLRQERGRSQKVLSESFLNNQLKSQYHKRQNFWSLLGESAYIFLNDITSFHFLVKLWTPFRF